MVATSSGASVVQSPEHGILDRAVEAARNAAPEWKFIPSICSGCLPLIGEQEGVASGLWQVTNISSSVQVRVHRIATSEAAARFLSHQLDGGVYRGWTVVPYTAGDGATMSTYPDPRGFTQYELTIRKGIFLVFVSGISKTDLERFSQFLLEAFLN
jgi:hypothetical protein